MPGARLSRFALAAVLAWPVAALGGPAGPEELDGRPTGRPAPVVEGRVAEGRVAEGRVASRSASEPRRRAGADPWSIDLIVNARVDRLDDGFTGGGGGADVVFRSPSGRVLHGGLQGFALAGGAWGYGSFGSAARPLERVHLSGSVELGGGELGGADFHWRNYRGALTVELRPDLLVTIGDRYQDIAGSVGHVVSTGLAGRLPGSAWADCVIHLSDASDGGGKWLVARVEAATRGQPWLLGVVVGEIGFDPTLPLGRGRDRGLVAVFAGVRFGRPGRQLLVTADRTWIALGERTSAAATGSFGLR